MKVGFVAGAFDLLHIGHIHLLEMCKQNCDYLIVAIHVDPSVERKNKNKPIESVFERQIKVMACRYVNKVVTYETEADLSLMLRSGDIDIRFLGSDYERSANWKERKPITDEDIVPIKYIQSLPIHTSEIRERIRRT